MIFSRLISLILRFTEFVCAAVVLGIDANFINKYRHNQGGPIGREIYIIIWAVFSVLFSLFHMIPTVHSMLHVVADIIFSAGWFAAFGLLVNYIRGVNCGSYFTWGMFHPISHQITRLTYNLGGITHGGVCNQWQAEEAFAFIAAVAWLLSAVVGVWVGRKGERRAPRHGV
jgi:hypothetical protein